MTDRQDVIAAALRAPRTGRPYVGHEMRGPMLMLTGINSDLIWSATIPQIAEAIDQALQEHERQEKGIPATGTTSTPAVPSNRRPADHWRIAADLRARPGQWGTVGIYRTPAHGRRVEAKVRTASGNYGAYSPAGYFETRTCTVADGARVEARYAGALDSAPRSEPTPAALSTEDAAWLDAVACLDEEER
ncbi:hypothetical protein [Streptomyces scabiei]|uniref:hypothetical protein n=1 Tax=Streptomyces scabiei TaxID=1930 RepID=UPI001B302BEC|nr:hypothetical protein [Streptomyces sp. LBUM 1475]QTU64262.1 hypothetical protein F3K22_27505 [Streptomyces sp. LBUM 1475]